MNASQESVSDMTVVEYLKAARELISDETHWCQNALAKDTPHGRAYCAVGALYGVENALELTGQVRYRTTWLLSEVSLKAHGALQEQLEIIDFHILPQFNNTRTHKEVLQLFDDTIARLEEQERGKEIEIDVSSRLSSTSPALLQPV